MFRRRRVYLCLVEIVELLAAALKLRSNRGHDYASDSLPFGFRSRLVFTAAVLRRSLSVRNILADL